MIQWNSCMQPLRKYFALNVLRSNNKLEKGELMNLFVDLNWFPISPGNWVRLGDMRQAEAQTDPPSPSGRWPHLHPLQSMEIYTPLFNSSHRALRITVNTAQSGDQISRWDWNNLKTVATPELSDSLPGSIFWPSSWKPDYLGPKYRFSNQD